MNIKLFMYMLANYPDEILDFILCTQDELLLYYYNKTYSKLVSTTKYYNVPDKPSVLEELGYYECEIEE